MRNCDRPGFDTNDPLNRIDPINYASSGEAENIGIGWHEIRPGFWQYVALETTKSKQASFVFDNGDGYQIGLKDLKNQKYSFQPEEYDDFEMAKKKAEELLNK